MVRYFWVFLIAGVTISIAFSAFGFMKQPLPNFLDPKRGFGARGEGTLTSRLIVLKNINVELTKYTDYIINVYEDVKKANRSSYDSNVGAGEIADKSNNVNQTLSNDDYKIIDDESNANYDDEETNIEEEATVTHQTSITPSSTTTVTEITLKNKEFLNVLNNATLIPHTSYSYRDILVKKFYKDYTGIDLINLLPEMTIPDDHPGYKQMQSCNYSLKLGNYYLLLQFIFFSLKTYSSFFIF